MANEVVKNCRPDIENDVVGLEIAPCHKCGCIGVVEPTLRRDKKYSIAIGCPCGAPYSMIYSGRDTVVSIVRLWNRYQSIHQIKGVGKQ